MPNSHGICTEPDCTTPSQKRGYCWKHAARLGLVQYPIRPACPTPGCPRKARSNSGAPCRKCQAGTQCLAPNCRRPIAANLRCDEHRDGWSDEARNPPCVVDGCDSPQWRARLCWRHRNDFGEERECVTPGCRAKTVTDYCGWHHNSGIDFKAGVWFDWVAVDQMFRGSHDPARRPTLPELAALFSRADREGVGESELARRLGVGTKMVSSWRGYVRRYCPPLEAAAA